MTDTSRSPYTVSASVRGMGVAVMTRTSGSQALLAQRRPLQHAEAMLLVDHHEAELRETHVALHERMGADDEVDRTAGDIGQLLASSGGGCRTGQQRDAKPRRLQQPRDVEKVLLGQDLGRRHEGDLQPVLHLHQRRPAARRWSCRRRRRPEAAGSSAAAAEVVDDFLERRSLPFREPERQHAHEPTSRIRSSTWIERRLLTSARLHAAGRADRAGT